MYIKGRMKPPKIFMFLPGKKRTKNFKFFPKKNACTGALAVERKIASVFIKHNEIIQ